MFLMLIANNKVSSFFFHSLSFFFFSFAYVVLSISDIQITCDMELEVTKFWQLKLIDKSILWNCKTRDDERDFFFAASYEANLLWLFNEQKYALNWYRVCQISADIINLYIQHPYYIVYVLFCHNRCDDTIFTFIE